MVVRIEVLAYMGMPPAEALVGEFDAAGGSIGRGVECTLTLPDAARHVSRSHAIIAFRTSGYVIQDRGSATPVYVNGRPVGNGHEAVIAHDDELRIGDYTLRVSVPGVAESKANSAAEISGTAKDDPLAAFGGVAANAADPFADLMPARPAARTPAQIATPDPFATPPSSRASVSGDSVIPADFDPFADPTPQVSALPLPEEFDFGVEDAAAQRFNDLFSSAAPVHDPLAAQNPPDGAQVFDLASNTDPLRAFCVQNNSPPPYQPAQRNDTPELNSAFRPPQVRSDDMVLSWEASPLPMPITAQTNTADDLVATPAKISPESPPRATTKPSAPTTDPQLLQAFLRGAGVADLNIPGGLTPEWMQLLGEVVREATQGTLDLLVARALTKRELRADATMIVARENNPLKFSPNVEAALSHLLVPHERGFMDPQQALRDAYDDLRSHQFGFMVGMRAALAGVLQRFDPQKLEQRLTQQRVIDTVLPIYRKANLWELFAELYSVISSEAEDDFHSLFGREFLRAYQEQINKLKAQNKEAKP